MRGWWVFSWLDMTISLLDGGQEIMKTLIIPHFSYVVSDLVIVFLIDCFVFFRPKPVKCRLRCCRRSICNIRCLWQSRPGAAAAAVARRPLRTYTMTLLQRTALRAPLTPMRTIRRWGGTRQGTSRSHSATRRLTHATEGTRESAVYILQWSFMGTPDAKYINNFSLSFGCCLILTAVHL